ncbi:MAG: hexitol phosphatase HxpB [Bacteroidota bacterium]|nr:hexitol phosphatase HxpB [Bacteroidota bacterium]MDP3144872.1 hexitol phosphatase HxpB [Bacteroidota bacterium]
MLSAIKAVIFDMDGVIIDSEPLWRRAMVKGFNHYGLPISEDDCRSTMGMRINEVVDFWVKEHSITKFTSPQIEATIMANLFELIELEGKPINGVLELFAFCKEHKLKIGLATSSSEKLMAAVLNKLDLNTVFDSAVSAQHLKYAKPNPEVFLLCANNLGINPNNCLVIEDSINGAIAAKAAQMKLIVVPDEGTKHQEKFAIADYTLNNMTEVLTLFKSLLK